VKSVVIYFSQTGNTEKIGNAIAAGIEQVTGQCDTFEIREIGPLELKEYDLIGLGSPVMGAAPANVIEFAGKMRFVGGKHCFTFCTHGTSYKGFHPVLYPVLAGRGLVVTGSADWYGDCHLLHMPQPYPTAGHPDAIDLQEAEAFGREMALRSMRISAGETDLIPPEPAQIPIPPDVDLDAISSFAKLLKFDREKCLHPNCTLCMDNCPTHGIDLSVNPPELGQPCLDCEFCARLCPTGALDMDEWVQIIENMTAKYTPMGLQFLEKAEAEGHFRRLLPLDKFNADAPGYKQHTTHPQWIIGKGAQ
jgi:flavodoxin/ferredoxin